jgi:hypothetical protein
MSYQFNPIIILDSSNASGIGSGGSLTVGGGLSVGKDMFLGGNLSISGTSTSFSDNVMILNKNPQSSVDTGILWQRYNSDITNNNNYAGLIYSETNDEFQFGYVVSEPNRDIVSMNELVRIKALSVSLGNSNTVGSIITTGGNVGIGAQPNHKLHVQGDINYTGTLYQNGVQFNAGASAWSLNGSVVYYTDGNVGIGTTNPSQKLHVDGTILSSGVSTTDATIGTLTTTTLLTTNVSTTNATASNLVGTAATIGTLTTTTLLTTNVSTTNVSTTNATASNLVGTAATIGSIIGTTLLTTNVSTTNVSTTNATASNLVGTAATIGTLTATTLGATIISAGSLHIGGTLTVVNITSTNVLNTNISASNIFSTNATISNLVANGDSNTMGSIITTGGNVGIGVNPSFRLHVSGDIFATGNVTAFSDRRLKTDIETVTDALDKVTKLRGVYYKMKMDDQISEERSVGVIAQEIQEILPEVVATKGEYLGVAYGNIVGILIEAIKELKHEIDELKRN